MRFSGLSSISNSAFVAGATFNLFDLICNETHSFSLSGKLKTSREKIQNIQMLYYIIRGVSENLQKTRLVELRSQNSFCYLWSRFIRGADIVFVDRLAIQLHSVMRNYKMSLISLFFFFLFLLCKLYTRVFWLGEPKNSSRAVPKLGTKRN